MNPIALSLGPIKIYWYSIIILLAIITGSAVLFKQAKQQNIKEEIITNLIFYGVLWGILGARIYYVLFNLNYYIKNPIEIVEIYNGGLAIHGGIIAGAIFFIYYSRKNKINFLKMFDIAAPALILGQAIGRWGNFINQEAHGPEVLKQTLENLPIPDFVIKGMKINETYYHPTFYYESVWNFLGFILLIVLRKKLNLKTGQLTGIYFVWYSIARILIESLRTDSLMLGPIKVAQVVSVILFLLGLYLILRKKKDKKHNILFQPHKKHFRNYFFFQGLLDLLYWCNSVG